MAERTANIGFNFIRFEVIILFDIETSFYKLCKFVCRKLLYSGPVIHPNANFKSLRIIYRKNYFQLKH